MFASFSTRFKIFAIFALFCTTTILYLGAVPSTSILPTKFRHLESKFNNSVRNQTLGFQQVFAIGFESRRDKRDALSIASSLTDIKLTWFDGVRFEDIPKKSIADSWDFTKVLNTTFAAWRAHMNVLQYIVDNRVQSALIIEDDSDWDWFLKDQLEAFSASVREIQNTTSAFTSPYGDAWNLLWLGHCRLGPTDLDQNLSIISNDPTVPPAHKRRSIWRQGHILPSVVSNDSRTVFKAHAGMCTLAYAVTYEGAQKIITSLSLQSNAAPYDVAISSMCRQAYVAPFPCYGLYPPIIASHRFSGSSSRDSDIIAGSSTQHPEITFDIVFSVIQNAARLLSGAQTVKSQWPTHTLYDEIDRSQKLVFNRSMERVQFSQLPLSAVNGINRFGKFGTDPGV